MARFGEERGENTRGQVAKILAGTDGVEIKATIPPKQIASAMQHFGLRVDQRERYIIFFDTPTTELFNEGIILRSRRIIGGQHDSTLKIRPVNPDKVPQMWRDHPGFKIEADASDKGITKSASLTLPVGKGLIKEVLGGNEPIHILFGMDQLDMLLGLKARKVDFTQVRATTPVRAWRWRFSHPGCPWPMTGELWQREDEAQLFEVSVKVPVVQAAAGIAGFMAFLAEMGAERDSGQQAKTRWVLNPSAAPKVQQAEMAQAAVPVPDAKPVVVAPPAATAQVNPPPPTAPTKKASKKVVAKAKAEVKKQVAKVQPAKVQDKSKISPDKKKKSKKVRKLKKAREKYKAGKGKKKK
jgi:hypothetical protein